MSKNSEMFINFLNRIIRILRRNKPAGNNLTILDDDTFIVSFPRSGNTWLRFLLGYYLFGEKFDFVSKENFIPAIKANSNSKLLKSPRPRILKSHSQYFAGYPKVIYLVRDPRDVIISHFKWARKNPNKRRDNSKLTFEGYSQLFFKGDFSFGRWDHHVLGWKENSNKIKNGFLFIKYEDLKRETYSTLKLVLEFLNINIDEKKLAVAIEKSSFERMKTLEKKQQGILKSMNSPTGNIDFVGSGKSEWDEYLIGNIKQQFKDCFESTMIALSYIQSTDW